VTRPFTCAVPITLGQQYYPEGVMLLQDGKDLLHPGRVFRSVSSASKRNTKRK